MKKLYIVSYYFAPLGRADGINRTYLVKYLSELGWDIEVISCRNPHAFLRNFQEDWSLMKVLPSEVKLHRIRSTYWGPLGGIAALLRLIDDPFRNWFRPVLKRADAIFRQEGIVYAIVPPLINAAIAGKVAAERQMPLVIDFRDNVFDLPHEVVQNARAIIASTPYSLQEMQRHYHFKDDVGLTIYNGYPVAHHSKNKSKEVPQDKLRIVFAGLLNLEQDPAMLARAVAHMEKVYPETRNKVSVDYYGPRNFYTRFFLPRYLSENICFRGYVPFKEVLDEIAHADLAYSSLVGEHNKYRVPSKVFQYIAMETPILATGPDGALKNLLLQYGIGRYSSDKDIEAQAADIQYFLTDDQAHAGMVANIRKIKPQFAMRFQAERLSEYLKKFV